MSVVRTIVITIVLTIVMTIVLAVQLESEVMFPTLSGTCFFLLSSKKPERE